MPLVTGRDASRDRPSFAYLPTHIIRTSRLQNALHDGSWTYVRDLREDEPDEPDEPDERGAQDAEQTRNPTAEHLFDLEWDLREDADLLEFEPAAAARVRARLDAHLAVPPRAGVNRENVRIDPAIAVRLRAVGDLE